MKSCLFRILVVFLNEVNFIEGRSFVILFVRTFLFKITSLNIDPRETPTYFNHSFIYFQLSSIHFTTDFLATFDKVEVCF